MDGECIDRKETMDYEKEPTEKEKMKTLIEQTVKEMILNGRITVTKDEDYYHDVLLIQVDNETQNEAYGLIINNE